MPKMQLLNIAVARKDGSITTQSVDAYVMRLYVGGVQHRFMVHKDVTGAAQLSDLRSGYRIGSLDQIKALNFRSYQTMTDRRAAELLIQKAIDRSGADQVRAKLAEPPTINP